MSWLLGREGWIYIPACLSTRGLCDGFLQQFFGIIHALLQTPVTSAQTRLLSAAQPWNILHLFPMDWIFGGANVNMFDEFDVSREAVFLFCFIGLCHAPRVPHSHLFAFFKNTILITPKIAKLSSPTTTAGHVSALSNPFFLVRTSVETLEKSINWRRYLFSLAPSLKIARPSCPLWHVSLIPSLGLLQSSVVRMAPLLESSCLIQNSYVAPPLVQSDGAVVNMQELILDVSISSWWLLAASSFTPLPFWKRDQ